MSFRIKLVIRLLIITLLALSGLYIVINTYFWLSGIWLLFFSVIAFIELVRFVEKGNRELANFLLSLKQNDFTGNYDHSQNQKLGNAFNVIIEEFKKLRQTKESNLHLTQAIIEQSTIPMIGYTIENGTVQVCNEAATTLLSKPYIHNLNAIKSIDKKLFEIFSSIQSGEKILHKTILGNKLLQLSVNAKELKLEGEHLKLITFQNIKQELDQKELESWQKLIRVLTHEIKNSAIPISTLTEVISQMLKNEEGKIRDFSSLDDEDKEDLFTAIQTIEKRSKGLVKFVNAYGELARVPKPALQKINVRDLVNGVCSLLNSSVKNNDIDLTIDIQNITMEADPDLLEQVLINLLKNAIDALDGTSQKKIAIIGYKQSGKVFIKITDNGPGIPTNELENIFIPFYTTKSTGSGIGLSLSREIIRAHDGILTVETSINKGTSFLIEI